MSRSPKNPWGNSGPNDDPRRALRLVEAPQVQPARPQWFSFRAAVLIATGILTAGVVWGAMVRIHAYVEAEAAPRESPVVVVESVKAPAEVPERVPREDAALPVPPPVTPQILVDAPRPEVLPEVTVGDLTEEPFVVSERWADAAEPFPEAKESPPEPKPVQSRPTIRPPRKVTPPKPSARSRPPAPKPRRIAASVRSRVQPVYPASARRAGVEGRVVVQASVRADGRVSSVVVASSSGSRTLDSAAMSAVRRWSFSPETFGGKAVASAVRVPVQFQLR